MAEQRPGTALRKIAQFSQNWMTAIRDDVVILTADQQNWQKRFITQIELYRVFPAEHNGETVESAQAWIDAGERQMNQQGKV